MFDVDERLRELSAKGDALERLSELVDFEVFRPDLERAVPRADGSKGGRPAFDHVLMFKVLLLVKRASARPVCILQRAATWSSASTSWRISRMCVGCQSIVPDTFCHWA